MTSDQSTYSSERPPPSYGRPPGLELLEGGNPEPGAERVGDDQVHVERGLGVGLGSETLSPPQIASRMREQGVPSNVAAEPAPSPPQTEAEARRYVQQVMGALIK